MPFEGKLENQTWENEKKLSFEPDFSPFGPNLGPNFFCGFYLHSMLDIVGSYHFIKFQGKLMSQTWKNGKKLVLDPILAHWAHIWAAKFFFQKSGFVSH